MASRVNETAASLKLPTDGSVSGITEADHTGLMHNGGALDCRSSSSGFDSRQSCLVHNCKSSCGISDAVERENAADAAANMAFRCVPGFLLSFSAHDI
jgi:hypothetical protein